MAGQSAELISDVGRMRSALSPFRLELLELLREAGSAATLSEKMGVSRQRIGYHLRALEAAGMLQPAGERQRRGFTEKLFVRRADAFVIDPQLLGRKDDSAKAQDRHAAGHLVGICAQTVREVTRMQTAAEAADQRLLTFAIEANVTFSKPQEIEDFTTRLAHAVADIAADFGQGKTGRQYRVLVGGHPAIGGTTKPQRN